MPRGRTDAPRLSALLHGAAVLTFFAVLAYAFCSIFFPLDATKLGGPGDFQPLASMDWIVAKTLAERHELPLWNPHVYTGLPLIGDPYVSFFNPAIVLPLLLFGPINGPKVAVLIAVALSGIGQYSLSRVVGQGRAISITAGVLGMSAGSLVARVASGFNFYQAMQHGWQAATLATFIVALRSGRPGPIAVSSVTYALLFHTGNIYLWLVLTVVMVLFGLGYALTFASTERGIRPRLNWRALGAAATVAALSAALVAVTALPTIEFRSLVDKAIDLGFRGTQPPLATLFSFVVSDRKFWERELFGASDLGWGVHYAYVGATAFAPLLLLVPATWRRPSRDLPLLAIAFGLAIAWASARHTFMWQVWQRWDVMRQLRYWSTATGAATIFLIPITLAGADFLWREVEDRAWWVDRWGPRLGWRRRRRADAWWSLGTLRAAGWVALVVLLFAIAADPWRVNRALWSTPPYDGPADDVLHWLRTHDDGAYAIESHNSLIVSVASVGHIRYAHEVLNSVWPPRPRLLPTPAAPDGGVFAPAPKYVVSRKVPQLPPGTLLADLPGGVVLRAPPGLPFSFVADPLRLPYGAAAGANALADRRVAEVPARFDGTNRVIAKVPSGAPDSYTTLVVMQTWAPGWAVNGPSGRRPAERLGGFIGASSVRPDQTYVFSYLPQSFLAGSAISLMGLAVSFALVIAEWGPRRPNPRPP